MDVSRKGSSARFVRVTCKKCGLSVQRESEPDGETREMSGQQCRPSRIERCAVAHMAEMFVDAMDREKEYRASAPAHGGVQRGGQKASAASGIGAAMLAWKDLDYSTSWVNEQQNTKLLVVGPAQDEHVWAIVDDACTSWVVGEVGP